MEINFECQKCRTLFDCEIGTVTFPENSDKPDFEKEIICRKCGRLSMGEVLLTEKGQSQLTEMTLGFDSDDIFDFEDDELNGFGLCEECAGKLELISPKEEPDRKRKKKKRGKRKKSRGKS
jgi:hypothetical protein